MLPNNMTIDENAAVDTASVKNIEKGVVQYGDHIYMTATRIADLALLEGVNSRAGVFKRVRRDNWQSIKVPYQGRADGAEHFQLPSAVCQLYMTISNNADNTVSNSLISSYKSNASGELQEWLITLCYNAYQEKYPEFKNQHTTLQLKYVSSLYNTLVGVNGVLSLSEKSYKTITTEDIVSLLDVLIKLDKALPFRPPTDWSKLNSEHSIGF